MSTFVLVHGAWHGAWCWQRLVPALAERGHAVVAVDLPADRDAGIERYAEVVVSACPRDGDVVVVGHSLAGLIVPVVAARVPVRHMVILCGFSSAPGESMNEVTAREPDVFAPGWSQLASRQIAPGDGSSAWPPDAAIEAFYHDCPPDLAQWAASRLRPQFWRVLRDPCPIGEFPDIPATYVLCRDDRVVNPEWSRRVATERLGVTAVELGGGHSPFLARPDELAGVLDTTKKG